MALQDDIMNLLSSIPEAGNRATSRGEEGADLYAQLMYGGIPGMSESDRYQAMREISGLGSDPERTLEDQMMTDPSIGGRIVDIVSKYMGGSDAEDMRGLLVGELPEAEIDPMMELVAGMGQPAPSRGEVRTSPLGEGEGLAGLLYGGPAAPPRGSVQTEPLARISDLDATARERLIDEIDQTMGGFMGGQTPPARLDPLARERLIEEQDRSMAGMLGAAESPYAGLLKGQNPPPAGLLDGAEPPYSGLMAGQNPPRNPPYAGLMGGEYAPGAEFDRPEVEKTMLDIIKERRGSNLGERVMRDQESITAAIERGDASAVDRGLRDLGDTIPYIAVAPMGQIAGLARGLGFSAKFIANSMRGGRQGQAALRQAVKQKTEENLFNLSRLKGPRNPKDVRFRGDKGQFTTLEKRTQEIDDLIAQASGVKPRYRVPTGSQGAAGPAQRIPTFPSGTPQVSNRLLPPGQRVSYGTPPLGLSRPGMASGGNIRDKIMKTYGGM